MSTSPKPDYFGREHSIRFHDRSVVDTYHLRPQYPEEAFDMLASLITGGPRAVLDIGCGSGDIARRLVDRVERIDAVDFSLPMIEKGKTLPNGDNPKLRWIHSTVEKAPLEPPYTLITAGRSMHWMDWDVVFPRFREALTPNGCVAILAVRGKLPWDDEIRPIVQRYSSNRRFRGSRVIEVLQERHLFEKLGEKTTAPVYFAQSLDDYIEAFHSRSILSREYMGDKSATALDNEIRDVVSKYAVDGMVNGEAYARIIWGRPL